MAVVALGSVLSRAIEPRCVMDRCKGHAVAMQHEREARWARSDSWTRPERRPGREWGDSLPCGLSIQVPKAQWRALSSILRWRVENAHQLQRGPVTRLGRGPCLALDIETQAKAGDPLAAALHGKGAGEPQTPE